MPKLPRPSIPYHHSAHRLVSLQLFHSGQICRPWRRLYASQQVNQMSRLSSATETRHPSNSVASRMTLIRPSCSSHRSAARHSDNQGRKRQAEVQCDGDAHVSGDDHHAVGASMHAWSATDDCQRRYGPSIDRKAGFRRDGFRVLCAAKDETSLDTMRRMFRCYFLRKSQL
jgi:hypothetical protein